MVVGRLAWQPFIWLELQARMVDAGQPAHVSPMLAQ
jgi:hypothetical protein